MKKLIVSLCAFLTAAALPHTASAFTYTNANADLLLIFRTANADVEFNLGTVSNFLNKTAGSVTTVSYDKNMVLSNNNGTLAGLDFVLVACTPANGTQATNASWLTDSDPASSPLFVTGSGWSQQYSVISQVGLAAALSTGNSATLGLAFDNSQGLNNSSYDYIASHAGQLSLSSLGGSSAFNVEQSIPGASRFFQVQNSTATPKPAAIQIGLFNVDASGVLTFIAGTIAGIPPQPTISATRAGGATHVTFASTLGIAYQLFYSSDITQPLNSWAPVGAAVNGTGSTLTLNDTASTATGFYLVQAYFQ